MISEEGTEAETGPVYPDNLTLGNLLQFLPMPTLVYQPAYPRSTRFRGRWLLWCAGSAPACCRLPLLHLFYISTPLLILRSLCSMEHSLQAWGVVCNIVVWVVVVVSRPRHGLSCTKIL